MRRLDNRDMYRLKLNDTMYLIGGYTAKVQSKQAEFITIKIDNILHNFSHCQLFNMLELNSNQHLVR